LPRSMETSTVGGRPKSGSVTILVLTWACPEKLTFSGAPITEPLTETSAEVAVVVVADRVAVDVVVLALIVACALTNDGTPIAARTVMVANKDRLFILVSFILQGRREDVVRRAEGHALRRRDRRRQRAQERRAVIVDLPAQQHRVVLVHRV